MIAANSSMLWVLAVASLALATSGANCEHFESSVASPGEFPFMVAIEKFFVWDHAFMCAGSIIDEWHVLTSASCVTSRGPSPAESPSRYQVKVGCHKRWECKSTHSVDKIMVYPAWNSSQFHQGNDIALLKLNSRIEFDRPFGFNAVRPVQLAPSDDSCCDQGVTKLTAVGWGVFGPMRHSDLLTKVKIESYPMKECKKFWRANEVQIGCDLICAKLPNENACKGDFGGPILKVSHGGNLVQVGLTSIGGGLCRTEFGGLYTKVSEFQSWIGRCTSDGNCPTLF